ncbi:hypothetical protein MTP99_008397 [Tenebrio molitor]|nr:hypothetical protein MTP99_008397 [Tenebrio molitor]
MHIGCERRKAGGALSRTQIFTGSLMDLSAPIGRSALPQSFILLEEDSKARRFKTSHLFFRRALKQTRRIFRDTDQRLPEKYLTHFHVILWDLN